ncbi:unnamed protein product, partial [Ixodes pacificus]
MRPGVNATWTRNTTAPAPLATTMAVPATPPTTRAAPLVGHALRPPRPTARKRDSVSCTTRMRS